MAVEPGHCNAMKRNDLGHKLLFEQRKASTDIEIMRFVTDQIIACDTAASANG